MSKLMGHADPSEDAAHDRFAAELLDALLAMDVVVEARYVPESFRIDYRRKDMDTLGQLNLALTYDECEGVSAQQRAHTIGRIASLAETPPPPDDWAGIRPLLRPVLRQITLREEQPDKPLLARPAMPLLAELVVIDQRSTMRFVGAGEPEKWGVTEEEIFAAARENLAETAFALAERGKPAVGPATLRLIDRGSDYYTSMLLLPGWLDAMRRVVGGRPVAFAYKHWGLLLVGLPPGGSLPASLLTMIADEFEDGHRRISPLPYTVDGAGEVCTFVAARDDPAYVAQSHARMLLESDVYGTQAVRLREQYERDGEDVHVPTLLYGFARADGRVFTVADWTQEGYVPSLLPDADYVRVRVGVPAEVRLVPFQAAVEILGLTPEPDLYPPRYRARAYDTLPGKTRGLLHVAALQTRI
ncbi:MAG TPA: hypothetical protein VH372_18225 [Actinospica sp.]|jgi:hypothetical protein|nr:hypothetical protein [Actinospica sp.]